MNRNAQQWEVTAYTPSGAIFYRSTLTDRRMADRVIGRLKLYPIGVIVSRPVEA